MQRVRARARIEFAPFLFALLLIGVEARAQNVSDYVVAARRTGAIEFIDSVTLKTVSRITVNVPAGSTGLNGVFVDPDGRTIYIEGPIEGENGCCWLYSIDIGTLETRKVASIWGTDSRSAFVSPFPGFLQLVAPAVAMATNTHESYRWLPSPYGRWWFGLKNGPAVKLYDVARGEITRGFVAGTPDESWWSTGTWLADRFYIYASHNGSARLWTLSPQSTEIGDGTPVPQIGHLPGCSDQALLTNIVASRGRLLVNEIFGSKVDRRNRCANLPGGAWILDPATAQTRPFIASTLYLSQLIPNRSGIYGITAAAQGTGGPVELVRIDAQTGDVLQSRRLDNDYWRIAVAPLSVLPPERASVALGAEARH